MRILAIDQATHNSGFCVMDDGAVVDSGVYTVSNSKARAENRIAEVRWWVKGLLLKWVPGVVVLEEVPPTTMGRTISILSQLFGVLENMLFEQHENYFVPTVVDWRSEIGIKANLEVTCPECGAVLQRITSAHVWKCSGMKFDDFKVKHGKKCVERDEREALKEASIAFVKAEYGIECGDDEADAICLATYMHRRLAK